MLGAVVLPIFLYGPSTVSFDATVKCTLSSFLNMSVVTFSVPL